MVVTKRAQILQITPASEIVFQGPFEHVVTSFLELKNPSQSRVCYKVKTTAPRRYCVRPNCGIIDSDGKVKIAIMLQPMEPGSQAERSKHKFMVQSTIIEDANMSMDDIWQNTPREDMMDTKLRCVFHTSETEQVEMGDDEECLTNKADASPTTASKQVTISTTSQQHQNASGDSQLKHQPSAAESISTTSSTPQAARITSSTPKAARSNLADSWSNQKQQRPGQVSMQAEKSMSSSNNLTASFLQPMSDDYKLVLVSLAMLILGVILGKYII